MRRLTLPWVLAVLGVAAAGAAAILAPTNPDLSHWTRLFRMD